MKLAVFVSGAGSNLQAIIDAARANKLGAELALVLANRPGITALERAAQADIPQTCLSHKDFPSRDAYETAIIEKLHEFKIDAIALAGFDRLLSPRLIRAFPQRILNIHPALLPAFPGLHSVRQALDYGAKVIGVTVHFVDEGMDTGPIILQESLAILPDETEAELLTRVHALEHRLYPEAIRLLAQGRLHVSGREVKLQSS